jgi:hypothetical protein
MARTFALAIPATWKLLLGRVLSACNAPVSQTGEVPENAGKKVPSVVPRCRVLAPFSFPHMANVSPFLHS